MANPFRLDPAKRRFSESSGQPSPAGIEPGPLERHEAERAAADDRQRELLAREAQGGGESARAEGVAELAPNEYGQAPIDSSLLLWRLLSGQFRFTMSVAGNVPIGGANRLVFPGEVAAGRLFIVRAIRVQAPAGSKLQLYAGTAIAPDNFREVVTSVQEYSGEPPGTLVLRGPEQLVAVITNTTAEGLALVRLEGDLVPREALER